MSSPLILALDVQPDRALELAKNLDPKQCKLKVGSMLFTSSGPSIVSSLKDLGFDIFLDLKFHDIPNTVYAAVKEACKLNVWMVNVHCSGGLEMLKSARKSILDNKTFSIENNPDFLENENALIDREPNTFEPLFRNVENVKFIHDAMFAVSNLSLIHI